MRRLQVILAPGGCESCSDRGLRGIVAPPTNWLRRSVTSCLMASCHRVRGYPRNGSLLLPSVLAGPWWCAHWTGCGKRNWSQAIVGLDLG